MTGLMEVEWLRSASIAAGFFGLLAMFLAFTIVEDVLKRFFPRMRSARRDRVITLTIVFGAALTMGALVSSVEIGERGMECDGSDPLVDC